MREADIKGWVIGRLPDDWFTEAPEIQADRDEIVVIGRIPQPAAASDEERAIADRSRMEAWREETRRTRVAIARQAEARLDRTISWGVRCGDQQMMFTQLAVPAMTRLRMAERRVLDTLIAAGVARSRSEALAWCVKLVAERQEEWLDGLRDAIARVEEVRRQGPAA